MKFLADLLDYYLDPVSGADESSGVAWQLVTAIQWSDILCE
jgi:hypothetical protein